MRRRWPGPAGTLRVAGVRRFPLRTGRRQLERRQCFSRARTPQFHSSPRTRCGTHMSASKDGQRARPRGDAVRQDFTDEEYRLYNLDRGLSASRAGLCAAAQVGMSTDVQLVDALRGTGTWRSTTRPAANATLPPRTPTVRAPSRRAASCVAESCALTQVARGSDHFELAHAERGRVASSRR